MPCSRMRFVRVQFHHEKAIFEILKEKEEMDLNELKSAVGLSNKQWDKGLKGLAKHGLTEVTKTDAGLRIAIKAS